MVAGAVKRARGRRPAALETDDIQGLALQGYGKLRAATFLVLEVTAGDAARAWLRGVLPDVPFGQERPSGRASNLAFTARGLRRLGLPEDVVAAFSLEFLEGMTSAHRSRLLGDEGGAAPVHWSLGGREGPPVDALGSFTPRTVPGLRARWRRSARRSRQRRVAQGRRPRHRGHRVARALRVPRRPVPTRAGGGWADRPTMHVVHPGEVVLGYLNKHGQYPRSPVVPASEDAEDLLPECVSGGFGSRHRSRRR